MPRNIDIPSISDYSHWGEEAAAVWYAENKYDMDHYDDPNYDNDDFYEDYDDEEDEDDDEPGPFDDELENESSLPIEEP